MSNSLDTDQARHMSNFVWPDLGLNCLRCSSADKKLAGKELKAIGL